ncbi:MAG TPA: hypothetical protein VFW03_02520 [Gemmatimonadaceae bacterium]|nr:hypothetical protein [Gemmatimonadaceae bacterium]
MPSDIAEMRRACTVVLAVSSVPVADPGSNMSQPREWVTARERVAAK